MFNVKTNPTQEITDAIFLGVAAISKISFPISGSTKHSITLIGQDEGKGPIVRDLADALMQATGVPQTSQKIIFKGMLYISL